MEKILKIFWVGFFLGFLLLDASVAKGLFPKKWQWDSEIFNRRHAELIVQTSQQSSREKLEFYRKGLEKLIPLSKIMYGTVKKALKTVDLLPGPTTPIKILNFLRICQNQARMTYQNRKKHFYDTLHLHFWIDDFLVGAVTGISKRCATKEERAAIAEAVVESTFARLLYLSPILEGNVQKPYSSVTNTSQEKKHAQILNAFHQDAQQLYRGFVEREVKQALDPSKQPTTSNIQCHLPIDNFSDFGLKLNGWVTDWLKFRRTKRSHDLEDERKAFDPTIPLEPKITLQSGARIFNSPKQECIVAAYVKKDKRGGTFVQSIITDLGTSVFAMHWDPNLLPDLKFFLKDTTPSFFISSPKSCSLSFQIEQPGKLTPVSPPFQDQKNETFTAEIDIQPYLSIDSSLNIQTYREKNSSVLKALLHTYFDPREAIIEMLPQPQLLLQPLVFQNSTVPPYDPQLMQPPQNPMVSPYDLPIDFDKAPPFYPMVFNESPIIPSNGPPFGPPKKPLPIKPTEEKK